MASPDKRDIYGIEAEKAIEWAGSVEGLANRIGVSRSLVYRWKRDGWIPQLRSYQLHAMSGYTLRLRERA